ncbi:hypothetical protein AVEN_46339-1 [Araneus ventricosus]|uniref:Uncharacterized protein n=1 Tax=Araneus ventricosus TaxID=182803 RepID=A0A4Y2KW47_ARAVE|nr:hypothetical protein AVEN_46339-1 [Araneus ventricosus]
MDALYYMQRFSAPLHFVKLFFLFFKPRKRLRITPLFASTDTSVDKESIPFPLAWCSVIHAQMPLEKKKTFPTDCFDSQNSLFGRHVDLIFLFCVDQPGLSEKRFR